MIDRIAYRRGEARVAPAWLTLVACAAVAGCRDQPPSSAADPAVSRDQPADCCAQPSAAAAEPSVAANPPLTLPDVTVVDQDGQEVRFVSDLVAGKVLAISFIFTTCTTVCPVTGATFSQLQNQMTGLPAKDVSLISISVDPANDRPEQLAQWGTRFKRRQGWTLVTAAEGRKAEHDRLLKALRASVLSKWDHPQYVLVVDGSSGEWQSTRPLAAPGDIRKAIDSALLVRGGRAHFSDAPLLDQDGRTLRLFSDRIRGKVVVINAFFTECKGSCPVMGRTLVDLQDRLGDRLGSEVNILSVSVDPGVDTPERLREYAERLGSRQGWYFLTGSGREYDQVLAKLGQPVGSRDAHTSIFYVGNERTGLWMKEQNPANADGLIAKVEAALADR